MNTKLHLNLINSIFLFTCFSFQLIAQGFERAEAIAGLGILEQNNGVAVADSNGDNATDLFVVAKSIDRKGIERTHRRLFGNNDDCSFTHLAVASGLAKRLIQDTSLYGEFYVFDGFKVVAYWGDYDNGGFPDLFFTNTFNVRLYRNQGDGTFQNVTATAGFNVANSCQF